MYVRRLTRRCVGIQPPDDSSDSDTEDEPEGSEPVAEIADSSEDVEDDSAADAETDAEPAEEEAAASEDESAQPVSEDESSDSEAEEKSDPKS